MKSFGTIKEHVPHHADDTDHHDHDSHHHEEDHSHDHGHHHHHEPQGLHENQQFDKVSYNRILGSEQRDKVAFVDYHNENHADWLPKELHKRAFTKMDVMIPYDSAIQYNLTSLLDRTEIEARIYNILRQMDFMELEKFDFEADYEKDLGLDSLEWTALLTSIEHEFHTVFEDNLYDHWRNIDTVIRHLQQDNLIY